MNEEKYKTAYENVMIANKMLEKENQKLKELCDKYEEEHNNAFKLWTTKMEEMPDYEERMKLKQENQKLVKVIDELKKHICSEWYCFDNESVEFEVAKDIINKLTELKGGSDDVEN